MGQVQNPAAASTPFYLYSNMLVWVLVWYNDNLFLRNQAEAITKHPWTATQEVEEYEWLHTTVSSAYSSLIISYLIVQIIDRQNTENRKGPSTEPCGTPYLIFKAVDQLPFHSIRNFGSSREISPITDRASSHTPLFSSFDSKRLCYRMAGIGVEFLASEEFKITWMRQSKYENPSRLAVPSGGLVDVHLQGFQSSKIILWIIAI